MKKNISIAGVLLFALVSFALAQTNYDAITFAYGYGNVGPLRVSNTVPAGGGTLIVDYGYTSANNGVTFNPFSTNAPITVGADTATPSAVSCSTPSVYQTCSVTVALTHAHGRGERVLSGTVGLQEAINYAYSKGGARVTVDPAWAANGGTSAIIVAATAFPNVVVQDMRPGFQFWSTQPSTTTLISAPTALTVATVTQPATCPSGGTCTWTAAQPYFRIAYVDALGGISAASTAYQPGSNITATVPVNIASPAASTGAVGWIAFAGTTALLSYQLPIVTTAGVGNGACTMTTLETVVPACAIGSAASFNAIYVNTNMLAPYAAQSGANVYNPVFQAHTTFGYQPSAVPPVPFQAHFGPFSANTGSNTSTQIAVGGTVNLPLGYLNYIGRTIRVRGKVAATATTAGIPTVVVALGWQAGYGAGTGAPTTLCTLAGVAVTAGTAILQPFDCVITTTAIGSTAVGSVVTEGFTIANAATTAATPGTDAGTATPVGSLALFGYDQLYVTWTDNGQAFTAAQLVDLHVETLQ